MIKTVYLAGPLFCTAERAYNLLLKEKLTAAGYTVLLPQENPVKFDAGRMNENEYRRSVTDRIFTQDLALLHQADALLFNLDGRVPDEGACVELGYAYAKGMPCFGIKTDVRTAEYGMDNMMIAGALKGRVAGSLEELLALLHSA